MVKRTPVPCRTVLWSRAWATRVCPYRRAGPEQNDGLAGVEKVEVPEFAVLSLSEAGLVASRSRTAAAT